MIISTMVSSKRFGLFALCCFALVAACTKAERPPADSTATTRDSSAPAPPPQAPPGAAVNLSRDRAIDLTRDGSPERLLVTARGPRYDSLDVRLEIRGAGDSLLYEARWGSELYFFYDPAAGQPDSAIQRKVVQAIDRLLHDSAFVRPRVAGPKGVMPVDTSVVRYDLAEYDWRKANGVGPFAELPPAADPGIDGMRIEPARVMRIAGETAAEPSFTFFSGGELTRTLVWSPTERRFVRVFECC